MKKYCSPINSDDGTKVWCHVISGVVDKKSVKAAHIVLKSLDWEELAYTLSP